MSLPSGGSFQSCEGMAMLGSTEMNQAFPDQNSFLKIWSLAAFMFYTANELREARAQRRSNRKRSRIISESFCKTHVDWVPPRQCNFRQHIML